MGTEEIIDFRITYLVGLSYSYSYSYSSCLRAQYLT